MLSLLFLQRLWFRTVGRLVVGPPPTPPYDTQESRLHRSGQRLLLSAFARKMAASGHLVTRFLYAARV